VNHSLSGFTAAEKPVSLKGTAFRPYANALK
jgi:hypothetical protein